MSELPLSGRVALVTGAAVRVGRAIALALAQEGADLAVHHRTSGEAAEETASLIRSLGTRAATFSADLADPEQCRALIASVRRTLGPPSLVVHSAANFHRVPLEETDERVWDRAMDVNARAGLLLVQEAAADLRRARGRVVLISDFLAVDPARNYLAHSVSKAAVEGLVRALAVELAPEVSVNGVAPGTVLLPEDMTEEEGDRYARKVPLRRNGSPEDVADAVAFLCRGPAFITGQVLHVDGGKSIT